MKNLFLKKSNILVSIFVIIIIIIGSYLYINKNTITEFNFSSMGTHVNIKIAEEDFNTDVFNKARYEFSKVEKKFGKNPDLNDPEVRHLFKYAMKIRNETNGDFSPFLGSVIKLWHFDNYKKQVTDIPGKKQIQKALKKGGLNLYALAKGYAIDKATFILKQNGIKNFIINAGGDILVHGKNFGEPWKIGIKNSNKYITCDIPQYSIATSSNLYNHYVIDGKIYGHLLNGNTGWPIQTKKTVSVVAINATTADTYATAFFIHDKLKDKKKDLFFIKQEHNKLYTYNTYNYCKIR